MLIETITFEIRDFKHGTFEEFVVENTPVNFEMISSHRCTREIMFIQLLDFDFARKERIPTFILFGEAVAVAFFENMNVSEIDDIDEMVGTY